MTAPVVSMLIMRAAVYRDLRAKRHDAGATAGGVYTVVEEEAAASDLPGKQ